MSIVNGQTGDANDFKNSSAGAGDAGKGVLLDAHGKIDKTMVGEPVKSVTGITAGNKFTGATLPEAAFIGDNTNDDTHTVSTTGTSFMTGAQFIGVGEKFAQKVTPAKNVLVSKYIASLGSDNGVNTGSFYATVVADNGGTPNGGAVLATSDTVAVGSGGQHDVTFTFATPYELTASTPYWLVLVCTSATSFGASAYGNTSGGTNEWAYFDTSSWTVDSNDRFRCKINTVYTTGKIYKTDTALTNAKKANGLVVNTVDENSTSVEFISVYAGFILSGFTGLTAGSIYYCNGRGTISTTDPGSAPKVGKALSTTQILAYQAIT